MKKILFVSKSMDIGGVEKSLVALLNTMLPDQYEVDLLLLEKKGGFLDQIPDWVNVIELKEYSDIKRELNLPPRRVIKEELKCGKIKNALLLFIAYFFSKICGNGKLYYKVVFRKVGKISKMYDVAVSYSSIINYVSWLVCYHTTAKKRVGWIHFDIDKLKIDNKLFVSMHRKMDIIYIVSQQGYDIFCKKFPKLKEKCEVKYNVIDKKRILLMAEDNIESINSNSNKIIITLGRLEEEKGQDIIPLVAEHLRKAGFQFTWYLIGDGNLRNKIETAIREKKLSKQVILLGTKSNPYPYLKQADIYVQTSLHEGFCITLAEAKIFEPVIVSTNFTGAFEQLEHYKNGYVVSRNVNDLAEAIMWGGKLKNDKIINNSSNV